MTLIDQYLEKFRLRTANLQLPWMITLILLSGFITRFMWVTYIAPEPTLEGGDGLLYTHVAQSVADGTGLTTCFSLTCYNDPSTRAPITTIGPIYPLFLSLFYSYLPGEEMALQASRIADVFIATLQIITLFWLGKELAGNLVGLTAATLLVLDLRFIVEVGNAHTETLFTLLLIIAVAATIRAAKEKRRSLWLFAGAIWAIAGLTRPIALIAPAFVLGYVALTESRRVGFKFWLWFTSAFFVTISPWLAFNIIEVGAPALAEGAAAHFWLGTQGTGQWEGQAVFNSDIDEVPEISQGELAETETSASPTAASSDENQTETSAAPTAASSDENQTETSVAPTVASSDENQIDADATEDSQSEDESTLDENPLPTSDEYVSVGLSSILESPGSYLQLLLTKFIRAYLQPSGTVTLGGESIKTMFDSWRSGQVTLGEVLAIPEFFPKLYMYLFHFGSIGLSLISIFIFRATWRSWVFILLVIVLSSLAYTFLTIIPRYLFPIMPLYIVLAALLIQKPRQAAT